MSVMALHWETRPRAAMPSYKTLNLTGSTTPCLRAEQEQKAEGIRTSELPVKKLGSVSRNAVARTASVAQDPAGSLPANLGGSPCQKNAPTPEASRPPALAPWARMHASGTSLNRSDRTEP